jgi:hypothetical protein
MLAKFSRCRLLLIFLNSHGIKIKFVLIPSMKQTLQNKNRFVIAARMLSNPRKKPSNARIVALFFISNV